MKGSHIILGELPL